MSRRRSANVIAAVCAVALPAIPLACGNDHELDAGHGKGAGGAGAAGGDGGGGGGGGEQGGVLCPTSFTFTPPPGATDVRVPGEWNGFDLDAAPELVEGDTPGELVATVDLPPGLHGYKIAYRSGSEVAWVFDPAEGRRKYVGGTENSAVKVPDCRLPAFSVASTLKPSRTAAWASATVAEGMHSVCRKAAVLEKISALNALPPWPWPCPP